MEYYYTEGDIIEPEVILDKDKNIFKISGRSLLVNAEEFFNPIVSWVRDYVKAPNPETILEIDFEYLNSSSVKRIVEILVVFESLMEKGKTVIVKWYYHDNDEIMQEKGEEIQSVVYLPFEIIKI